MNQDEAIRLARQELVRRGSKMIDQSPHAIFKQRHMRLGKDRSGWLVTFRLNVSDGFEPNMLHVEVYEPNGEVHIPEIL